MTLLNKEAMALIIRCVIMPIIIWPQFCSWIFVYLLICCYFLTIVLSRQHHVLRENIFLKQTPTDISRISSSNYSYSFRCVLRTITLNTKRSITFKHNTLIFVIQCFMFRPNEKSSGNTLQNFKELKYTCSMHYGSVDLT